MTEDLPLATPNEEGNHRPIEDPAEPLVDIEATLQTLTAGQVDAGLDPASGIPIPQHQAQTDLRWARDELEERVQQRTAELARASRLLQALIETMPVGAVISDADGNVLLTNMAGREILGSAVHGTVASPERSYTPYFPNGSPVRPQDMPLMQALVEGQTVRDVEMLIRRADGEERTILASAAPIRDEAGDTVSGITVFQDITDPKHAETALRQYADRLQILQAAGQVILSARSVDELVETVLPFTRKLAQSQRASVLAIDEQAGEIVVLGIDSDGETRVGKGTRWQSESASRLEALAQNEMTVIDDISTLGGQPALVEVLQSEGVRSLVSLPLMAQGQMLGILNLALDNADNLTSQRREAMRQMADELAIGLRQAWLQEALERHAEELELTVARRTAALQASEARFRTIFEDSILGIALLDTAGQIVSSNPALQNMLGYGEGELAGTAIHAYSYPHDARTDKDLFQSLADGELDHYQVEKRFIRKDGQVRWSTLTVSRVERTRGDRRWLAVATLEDTTRRKEAETLQRQNELRQRIALNAIGGGIYDHAVPLDDTTYHSEGWAQILGYRLDELPSYAEFMGWLYDQVHPDDLSRLEHAYGDFVDGRTERYEVQIRLRHKNGHWFWVEGLSEAAARDENGRVTHVIGLMRDITERKEAEAALLQSEKLTVTAKLTAQLAHEINNPLQSVIGCLGLAKEALAEGRETGEYVNVAMREMKRVANIVAQLRNVHAQPAKKQRRPIDVKEMLAQVVLLTQGQWEKRGVEIAWDEAEDLPQLILEPDRVRQLLLNLVLNAIEAMPQGGELRIGLEGTDGPTGVRFSFRDTGQGIPPDILPHIFEPFVTTKTDGMGLGLYVTRGIVAEQGGHIQVDSCYGSGTTVEMWLPTGREASLAE